jgi:hypothetical protein
MMWIRGKIQDGQKQISAMPQASRDSTEVASALEMLTRGTRDFLDALDEIGTYFNDGDPEHLSRGLEMALDAGDRIIRVQILDGSSTTPSA